jgi:hypothetical protein
VRLLAAVQDAIPHVKSIRTEACFNVEVDDGHELSEEETKVAAVMSTQ